MHYAAFALSIARKPTSDRRKAAAVAYSFALS
jgi:hypothetical protein